MTTAGGPALGGDLGQAHRTGVARAPEARSRPSRFFHGAVDLFKEAGVRWADDACYRLGASLAYYALFSIFPLLLLSVTAIGFVLGDDPGLRERLLNSVASGASPASRTLLDQTLESMQSHRAARGVGAVVGIVALLMGASGVFSELETTLKQIWRVKSEPASGVFMAILRAVRDKAFAFVIVIATAISLLALLVLSTAVNAVGDSVSGFNGWKTLWQIGEIGVSFAFLGLLLAAIYRIVPQASVRWGDVFLAAFVTALLFVGLKGLLAWYLAHLASYAAYGAVGGVLGLLTWIYIASLVLFYGAELSRVYAEKFGSLRGHTDP